MKLNTFCCLLIGSGLAFMSTTIQADENDGSGKGLQNAIDQHNSNIERFAAENPDKDLPRGLTHSRDVLERVMAGERPERPEMPARPERPELPDLAMRPDRPETPVRPSRPEKPDMGRP